MRNPTPAQIDSNTESTGENTYEWTFTGTIEVSDVWVADGFDLTPERLRELIMDGLQHDLAFARESELGVTAFIQDAPHPQSIRKEQGY